jgi:hypothetical protein
MKEIRLKELNQSFESGIITTEEYEKKKKEVDEMPDENIAKEEEKGEDDKDVKLKSDKTLIVVGVVIILLFGAVFGLSFFKQERPQTIEELHELNFKGKLKPDEGYLYEDAYSFVKFEGLWYSQLTSPQGTRLYNIQFRYGPKEVDNIKIQGFLDNDLLNDATQYYVTFNPTGQNFSAVALAVGDFNSHMTNIFIKQPVAACDKNETSACVSRPIITCENTDELVLYVKESNVSRVNFNGNCILVEGNGFDLVKGVDRVLYDLYDIIS